MQRMLPFLIATGGLLLGAPLLAQDAQSRLWDAAIAGDTPPIRQAVADGAKIDSLDTRRNPNGRLALNWAAWHDRVPAIQLLIALGAPLEAENRTGFSALHHAAEAGSLEAARALLAARPDSVAALAGLAAAMRMTGQAGAAQRTFARVRAQIQARQARLNAEQETDRGMTLWRAGHLGAAAVAFRRATAAAPGYAAAHNDLGSVLALSGDVKHAVRQFALAVRLRRP